MKCEVSTKGFPSGAAVPPGRVTICVTSPAQVPAVLPEFLQENYPWTVLSGAPNVLVFPELQSANAAYKLVWRLGKAEAIGPILMGMGKPVHVLQRGVEVSDIVNMAAFGVVDAQSRKT